MSNVLEDELLRGEKETLSVTVAEPLKAALASEARIEGYGGPRQFSRFVERVLLAGIRALRAEREAALERGSEARRVTKDSGRVAKDSVRK